MKHVILLLYISIMIINVLSCQEEEENETLISINFSNDSHNTGSDCISCHLPGGDGEGWFTLAGTVYDSTGQNALPNGKVELFHQPGNPEDLVALLEVDAKGNFYSTEDIDFGEGLEALVTGPDGKEARMLNPITTGSCNSCHNGVNTDKIIVE